MTRESRPGHETAAADADAGAGAGASRRGPSIRDRMMRVVMTTTLVALLASATALLIYELHANRANWAQDLQTQADLVAQASVPAFLFDDARVARENLALLRLRPQIQAAALYDTAGTRFAEYTAAGQAAAPAQLADLSPQATFIGDQLELRHAIVKDGAALGTVVLRAHYEVLPRLLGYLAILGAVTLASLVVAALVAQRLQRTITGPIVAVSEVAREVMQRRDYTLRAPRTTDDEVGTLVDAFNDMLHELGTQNAALQAADRRKDEFLATLAHELRNPLAPVSTALEILTRPDVDVASRNRMVAMMKRQMTHLVRLIDDLMEVSRITTGHLTLRLETLDLVEVLRSAVEGVNPMLLERRHRLEVNWPPPVLVEGDRTRLGQVFANLLGNAAKYTPPGGCIEVAFEMEPGGVVVNVSDNGIGIAPDMQREVFEMFVRVDHTGSDGRAGLGVGLSLARRLVTLHTGTLELHSAGLGRGTRCTVRLPRAAAPPSPSQQAPTPAPAVAAARRALRVLVADDNRDFADSLATLLRNAGYQVRVAYDGMDALRAAQASPPDVGLFDIGMPGMDGYALAASVRRDIPAAGLLVAITGWGQQADHRRAREAGFDEQLVKPVDIDTLLGLLAARS